MSVVFSEEISLKPKLLFVRGAVPGLPTYIKAHLNDQVRCLEQFFDVTLVSDTCAYEAACDKHMPDLLVIESGVYTRRNALPGIHLHPQVPKVGLIHCDAYCPSRDFALADMEKWGVEAFFTTAVSLPFYTPPIRDKVYVWPNFVNQTVCRDYSFPKVIPILFTGSQAAHYPWRRTMNRILSERYPSMQSPHGGWFDANNTSRMLSGEPYAKLINAAQFVPACGTIADELVRKHLEIPACNTCLIAPPTAALIAAGFVDMVNCVFAEGAEVVEKVDYLFGHGDELQQVTEAGRQLVINNHSIENRDQILQWFLLNRALKQGQRIVQPTPFAPLVIVDDGANLRNGHVAAIGVDRRLLDEGDREMSRGDYNAAETRYRACLNLHEMPEPRLRLALCCLYTGRPAEAIEWITDQINKSLARQPGSSPDPVLWAYYLVGLLCLGREAEAWERVKQAGVLAHHDYIGVYSVLCELRGEVGGRRISEERIRMRYSVHTLPDRTPGEWLDHLQHMLTACTRTRLAAWLESSRSSLEERLRRGLERIKLSDRSSANCELVSTEKRQGVNKPISRPFAKRLWRTIKRHGRAPYKWVLLATSATGERIGWKAVKASESDECGRVLSCVLRSSDTSSALLIGGAAKGWPTETFLRTMQAVGPMDMMLCVNEPTRAFEALRKKVARTKRIECRVLRTDSEWNKVSSQNFDAVVIDGLQLKGRMNYTFTRRERIVAIVGINSPPCFGILQEFLRDRRYTLVAHDPLHGGGFAAFKRVASGTRRNLAGVTPWMPGMSDACEKCRYDVTTKIDWREGVATKLAR